MNIEQAMQQMQDAELSDRIKGQAARLLNVFNTDHTEDIRTLINTFFLLVSDGNLPVKKAVAKARSFTGLKPWQKYILDCIPESTFVPLPDYAARQSAMWRFATWEAFASDTVQCYGTMSATVLSMAYKPKVIVEMGLYAGHTTLLLCKANPEARVYGVDINSKCPGTDLPICFHAWNAGVDNLTVEIMPSWDFSMWGGVDLCFIDGEHCGEAPYKDSRRAWENRRKNGDWCIAWDDYHPNNPDVKNAVDRFVSEVGMPLWTIGSWVFIGTKGPDTFAEYMG